MVGRDVGGIIILRAKVRLALTTIMFSPRSWMLHMNCLKFAGRPWRGKLKRNCRRGQSFSYRYKPLNKLKLVRVLQHDGAVEISGVGRGLGSHAGV